MKLKNPFKKFNRFEWILWISSLAALIITFLVGGENNILIILATLIGVTGLVFIAKGDFWGQICTIAFSILYGIVSISFAYYGEFITYVFMTLPMAVIALISWARNPYEHADEVKIGIMTRKKYVILIGGTALATFVLYFVLKAFHTNNMLFSTISIATSFLAAALTAFRNPYYALAYAANDVVLIVLWTLATINDPEYLPMIISFCIFLIQDIYGFVSWQRMKRRQHG